MNILEGAIGLVGALATSGMDSAAETGQKVTAALAYDVYRHTKHGKNAREWDDLTQNEQREWTRAVGVVLDKATK